MAAHRPVVLAGGRFKQLPAGDRLDVPADWDALKAPAIASGALVIDLTAPAGFRVALNQNVNALSFANVPAGRVVVFTITWVQDATGGRTVAFPASVKADGGGAPVQPAAGASAVTVQSFYTDDGGVTVWQAGAGTAGACISGQVGTAFTGNPGLTGGTKLLFNEFWTTHPDVTYDAATRRFTFNRAGVYRCRCNGQTTASTNRMLIGLNNDAPGLVNHRGQDYKGVSVTLSVEGTFPVNAGDYVVFYLYEGGLYNDANNRWGQFSIERVL